MIAVDASGQARLDENAGTGNDRFTPEVEIARADFAELGPSPENGFRDEIVELRANFYNRLQFSWNLVNDITFETDICRTAMPEAFSDEFAIGFVR